jgi:hypothetical protein
MVVGLGLVCARAMTECAVAEDVLVVVNGQAHALFGAADGNAVFFELPAGTTRVVVRASGAAFCAPGRKFGGVIFGQHSSPAFEFVAIPLDVPVDVAHSGGDERAVLFFADETAADNAGALQVSVTPDVGLPLVLSVDSALHCVEVARAVTLDVAAPVRTVQASGSAWWAGAAHPYTSVVVMADAPATQTRHFMTVPIGGPPQSVDLFPGARAWLFFADLSTIVSDNGGDVVVTFFADRPIGAQAVSWGAVKRGYAFVAAR